MVAVNQYLRLDDRHNTHGLTHGGIAGQHLGIGFDGLERGQAIRDMEHIPPLGKPGTHRFVMLQPCSQAIQPIGNLVPRGIHQRAFTLINLDAGHNALTGKQIGDGDVIQAQLFQGFVVQNHAADVLAKAGRGENNAAVFPPCGFRGFHADRLEALGDGRGALVGSQYAFAGLHQVGNGGNKVALNGHGTSVEGCGDQTCFSV